MISPLKRLDFLILSLILLFLNIFLFKTIITFDKFLSCTPVSLNETTWAKSQSPAHYYLHLAKAILTDVFLIKIFFVQHSLLKKPLETVLKQWEMSFLQRSLYNFLAAASLQILMYFWKPVTIWTLWHIQIDPNSFLNWCLGSVRFFTWMTLLSECIILDISELLGWKQVVYHFSNMPPPAEFKSYNLNQTLENMRHPGLIEFTILFWATPCMSLDKCLFNVLLTLYLMFAFHGDCHHYVQRERERKLSSNFSTPPVEKRVRFS